jgi:glutamyl-tRNA synthetase
MSSVRVRFAPSPTGHLHIGGVRTALFNWLFARHHGGVFILRIEDTDRSRSTEEAIHVIEEGMKWLGLNWDEGPYRQTDRLDRYSQHADILFKEGKAYWCDCSPEQLEARRAEALRKGLTPKYDGRCRDRGLSAGPNRALRFRAPQTGQTIVEDLIKGTVIFDNMQSDDLIMVRADGFPTYNFCVVIDDVDMKITHVIRGDDHLNNTPRQMHLYHAFGYNPPQFAHVSMILGPDKARLSKRHGATSVLAYREMGYLPEALVNYLSRLSWSSGDQEIFSLQELVEKFSLEAVGKSAAVFNPDKLLWLNAHYIHTGDLDRLIALLKPFLVQEGLIAGNQQIDEPWFKKVVLALKERSRTLVEMAQSTAYFFKEEVDLDPKAKEKFLKPSVRPLFEKLIEQLLVLPSFDPKEIEKIFQELIAGGGIKLGDLAQPVRVALTGRTVSPGIYEVMELLGKERTIARLKSALTRIGA